MVKRDVSGEITELQRGRKYSIRVRMPPDENHKSWHWSKSRKVFGNKMQASAELVRYREELAKGEDPSLQSVAEYARAFQNERKERCDKERLLGEKTGEPPRYTLSPDTIDRDEIDIRRIEEKFSAFSISGLTSRDITAVYRKLEDEGVSASALHKLHRKLSQVMKRAVKEGLIASSPCDQVDGWKRPKPRERKSLTVEQATRLANDLRSSERNGCVVAVWIALATGARRGEILGLRWKDVDLERGRIVIEKQLDRHKDIRSPKSAKSERNLSIDAGTICFLKEWKGQVSALFYAGEEVPGGSPVCTNQLGEWLEPNFFGRWRREYFAAHGLGHFEKEEEYIDKKGIKRYRRSGYRGFNLHELRHTQATLLIGSGADIKTVQNRLGHSSASLTMDIYAHAIEQNDRNAANSIGGMLNL